MDPNGESKKNEAGLYRNGGGKLLLVKSKLSLYAIIQVDPPGKTVSFNPNGKDDLRCSLLARLQNLFRQLSILGEDSKKRQTD